jgi:putative membrane protein
VARQAPCAVLLCKGTPRPVQTVVVALDGSLDSAAAFRFFSELPLPPGLTTRLLGVVQPLGRYPSSAPDLVSPALISALKQYEDGLREALQTPLEDAAHALRVLILRPVSALAQGRPWDWSSHPMMFAWGAGGLVMMLMMVLVWALLIVGLVFGVRWLAAHGRPAHRDEAAEILRQRYARGEIDKQEFEMLKRDLGL